MGVTGLWNVVKPCARPIRLETLNKKRLAVDASIWIYHFLKAVRDKEGNALRNAHVVGFFRRICKLLYFGIKPVFVFDGGAPELKRQTIAGRRKRREGRQEDASKTAERLLAIQMQKKAEEEVGKSRGKNNLETQEEPLPQNLVYAEEALLPAKERQNNRQFRKKDAYHLPELEVSLEQMGAPNDPRVMSHEELEEYAKIFHSGESLNLYDFTKIDFDSPFFLSLPASDRYNILNAARLRSRLRMGYSKEQLDSMFPNRMEFSKFQIDRVKERNDLTQRLMNINGMNGEEALYEIGSSSRIASEKNKEYVLVKDSEVEGGWALGVLGNKGEGQQHKPIDVEQYGNQPLPEQKVDWEDEDSAFEDVPIEGLNRLPKLPFLESGVFDESLEERASELQQRRQSLYSSRRQAAMEDAVDSRNEDVDNNALFVESTQTDLRKPPERVSGENSSDEEALRQAIHMSLESPGDDEFGYDLSTRPGDEDTQLPTSHTEGTPREDASESDDNEMDLFAAISKSKLIESSSAKKPPAQSFGGLLPFEPLKPRGSTKPSDPSTAPTEGNADGFERVSSQDKDQEKQPLPPWFTGISQENEFINEEVDDPLSGTDQYRSTGRERSLGKSKHPEIIGVDDLDSEPTVTGGDYLMVNETKPSRQVGKTPSPPIPRRYEEPVPKEVAVAPNLQSTQGEVDGVGKDPVSDAGEENYEWQASDLEDGNADHPQREPASPSPEFEEVELSKHGQLSDAPQTDVYESTQTQGDLQDQTVDMYREEDDFSDPEDAELLHQLSLEAEEHARFASSLNSKSRMQNAYDYEAELKQLRSQHKKDRRDADEVTHIMVSECQQLLRLFGLPYITAPMEAEAQCADLVSLGLVDGIVTDDSDIFLFGGNRIYKNMFNQAKYVECYLTSDLEKEYALDRQKLVRYAHLLGSDYTEGIPGIGPVTASEIITEFSTLEEFRDWWSQVQMAAPLPQDSHSAFRKKFKKKATKLFLPPAFPDQRVDAAYLNPEVDSDPSAFQWGVPDLNAIRQFLMSTIGWSEERTDEVLIPVIRDANRREQEGTQANITNFFQGPQGAGAFAPRRRAEGQTRMEKAFSRLRHEAASKKGDRTEGNERKESSRLPKPKRPARGNDGADGVDNADEAENPTPRKPRKKRRQGK